MLRLFTEKSETVLIKQHACSPLRRTRLREATAASSMQDWHWRSPCGPILNVAIQGASWQAASDGNRSSPGPGTRVRKADSRYGKLVRMYGISLFRGPCLLPSNPLVSKGGPSLLVTSVGQEQVTWERAKRARVALTRRPQNQ
jgi:hypothetical protein